MNRAVFFDRDGTLITDRGYLRDPSQIEFLPGAVDLLQRLKKRGYLLVLVSNQSGIARGFFKEQDLQAVHNEFVRLLAVRGVAMDAYYYCRHGPNDRCECRKPNIGMALAAQKELDIDLSNSYMVGDKDSDLEFGRNFGAKACFYDINKLNKWIMELKI